jgi:hypothetical protein
MLALNLNKWRLLSRFILLADFSYLYFLSLAEIFGVQARLSCMLYMYLYMCACVCVCVCACLCPEATQKHIGLGEVRLFVIRKKRKWDLTKFKGEILDASSKFWWSSTSRYICWNKQPRILNNLMSQKIRMLVVSLAGEVQDRQCSALRDVGGSRLRCGSVFIKSCTRTTIVRNCREDWFSVTCSLDSCQKLSPLIDGVCIKWNRDYFEEWRLMGYYAVWLL